MEWGKSEIGVDLSHLLGKNQNDQAVENGIGNTTVGADDDRRPETDTHHQIHQFVTDASLFAFAFI